MFLTDLHRKTISEHFDVLRQHLRVLEILSQDSGRMELSPEAVEIGGMAAARATHIAIECVTDVGNVLIDALVMRDPSSYTDIVDILADEAVLPKAFAAALAEVVAKRKTLTHDYASIQYEFFLSQAGEYREMFDAFIQHVDAYVAAL